MSVSKPKKLSLKRTNRENKGFAPKRKADKEKHTEDMTVRVDRRLARDRRGKSERRVADIPVAVERRKLERRAKISRRRQIDPTTCERDYSGDEIEFMGALDAYKRTSGRMFPTCSEILEVIRGLGYEKRQAVPCAPSDSSPPSEPAATAPAEPASSVVCCVPD